MKHYKTPFVILISLFLLYGCKETPSGVSIDPNTTELEIKNDLNIGDPFYVERVYIDRGIQGYSLNKKLQVRHGESGVVSFTEDEVSKLTNLDVRIITFNIGYDSGNNVITPTPLYLDFTLGERRVVRIVCIELKTPTECESDGITYTIED
jgi:uncharacterized lipoprotein YajG